MSKKQNFVHIIFLTTILAILLCGCDFTKIRIGEVRMMYGANEDGHISYDFMSFTGFESGNTQAETGQTLFFEYQAKINKGTLSMEWQNPNGEVIWLKNITGTYIGSEEIVIDASGKYTIVIQGKGAGGSFDVSWNTK